MTVRRLSISVPPEIEELIRRGAERAGLTVSAWLARAAEHLAGAEEPERAPGEVAPPGSMPRAC